MLNATFSVIFKHHAMICDEFFLFLDSQYLHENGNANGSSLEHLNCIVANIPLDNQHSNYNLSSSSWCHFDSISMYKYLIPEIYNIFDKWHSQCLKNPNILIWTFEFWHFSPIFVLLKVTCQVTLFDHKLQVFKNSPNWPILAFFMNFCLNC